MFLLLLNLMVLAAPNVHAQGELELRGTVLDETGAYLVSVPVVLDDGKGHKYSEQTNGQGKYRFAGVIPGVYTITVQLEGFAEFTQQVDLTTKRTTPLDITLKVFIKDEVEVKTDTNGISTEPDKNLSAITLTEKDLEALPDDPDELLDTLKQMAGAAMGNDASVYVGGFRERGSIPPKEAIQMIRINSNPFSAEFSEIGFARIEIITKPGSDRYHGGFNFRFNDESLNARKADALTRAPLQTRNYGVNFNGPIIRNRWGFFADMERRSNDENDVVNAIVLNPITLTPEPFSTTVLTPSRNTNFSVRSDYLLTKKFTVGGQYRMFKTEALNQGLGSAFDLPERAFNRSSREDTFRFSLTTIASEHTVNETRLQFSRRTSNAHALTELPAIQVQDSFSSGGNQGSLFSDNRSTNQDITNNTTYTHKKHTLKMGMNAEGERLNNFSRSNFGGTFTFSSIDQYRSVLAGEQDAHPEQFSITRGNPATEFSQWEMAWFAQDDFRVSPRLTLSYGVRHEFQTHLQDKMNFAPRFGVAWAPDKKSQSTIRAGGGIFYNRLDSGITYDTIRLNGENQLQFTVTQPDFFPNIPDVLTGAQTRLIDPTIRVKDGNLNSPYTMLSTISYERRLPHNVFTSVGYSWQRGVHLLRTRNINAPTAIILHPGAPPPDDREPVLPFPGEGPILQYESTGFSNRHELRTSLRFAIGKYNIFANYTLSSTKSDVDGSGGAPSNQYDLSSEYGRSSLDARHQLNLVSQVTLPWNIRLSPIISIVSSRPFNILTGRDNNLDTLNTDRPAFGIAGAPNTVVTRFGVFNLNPQPGDVIIPRNFADGPGRVTANLNFSRTFGFGGPLVPSNRAVARSQSADSQGTQPGQNAGRPNRNPGGGQRPAGGGGGRMGGGGMGGGGGARGGGAGGGGFFGDGGGPGRSKYNITLSVSANNILNHTNFPNYIGTVTSPFFGISNRTLPARRIDASLRFSF